jgi:hypothetical protein
VPVIAHDDVRENVRRDAEAVVQEVTGELAGGSRRCRR